MMWRPRHIDKEMHRMNMEWRIWIDRLRHVIKDIIPDARVKLDKSSENSTTLNFIIECNNLPNTDILIDVLRKEVIRKSNFPFYSPFRIVLRSKNGSTKQINIP